MYNYYFNGNDCAVCPKGTIGVNCLSICGNSTYGELCSQTCNCSNSLCHHVYGCTGMSSALDEKTTVLWTFTGTTNTTQEMKAERDTDTKDISTITGYIHVEQILVLLAGTASTLTLLLLIAREMFKLFRMSETSGLLS
ncbi:uncharacterized protein LOC111110107 [Crassostrea virginica]